MNLWTFSSILLDSSLGNTDPDTIKLNIHFFFGHNLLYLQAFRLALNSSLFYIRHNQDAECNHVFFFYTVSF